MPTTCHTAQIDQHIASVRRFTRFYTQKIGVLQEGLLDSPFSLAQARVLYELAYRNGAVTAAALCNDLGLDAGYLSRILRDFHSEGLLKKSAATDDARQSHLALTSKGRKAFAPLDAGSRAEIARMLENLNEPDHARLTTAMTTIERLLGDGPPPQVPYVIRPPAAGDMGWVVSRHGVLYAREYSWDIQFEALVAEIVAQFVQKFDERRERCWIAERDGEPVGSVFLVRHTQSIAKLRLLLVEPQARGLGIGARLVEECMRFARAHGYRKMILWTNDVLIAARHIYEKAGFVCTKREQHHSFGHDLSARRGNASCRACAASFETRSTQIGCCRPVQL